MATKQLGMWKRKSDGIYYNYRNGTTKTPPGGATDLPVVPAITGTTFHNSWGTRIFPSYSGGTGGELLNPTGKAWLTNLKPGFVTHRVTPNFDSNIITFVNDIYSSHGIKSVLTVGQPFTTYTSSQWNDMIASITAMGDSLLAVTGQNEVNHVRGGGSLPSNWKELARDHQIELWNRMATLNATRVGQGKAAILVGNPNLWSGNPSVHDADAAAFLPMVKDYCNLIAWHLYPRGVDPTWNLDHWYNDTYKPLLDPTGVKPVMCTEAGYFVAYNYTGGAAKVSEWAHDIYLRKMWLEYALRGWKVGQFELLNDVDASDSNREANFGLIETPTVNAANWFGNDAWFSIKSWCNDINGGSSTTANLLIETDTASVYTLVVNHATGTRVFAWRRVRIEDSDTSGPKTLSPATIAIGITHAGGYVTRNIAHDVEVIDL